MENECIIDDVKCRFSTAIRSLVLSGYDRELYGWRFKILPEKGRQTPLPISRSFPKVYSFLCSLNVCSHDLAFVELSSNSLF